ncbi:MAG TPA: hypothetical protein VHS03_01725 [Gaiellaceae bacterium]|nr:hypothetical protein [Gaiellaceae bacterium]
MRRYPLALGALVLVFALSPVAGTQSAPAATPCWQAVISDWSNDGKIEGTYSAACYRQAMQNAPTDLKVYSSLEDDLQSALARRSARRLAGAHEAPAALGTASGSSWSMLVALLAGCAALLAAGGAAAVVRSRSR